MATNPMQRKARQSFLLGMVVMLLISGVVIGFLLYQLMQIKDAEKAIAKTSVCVLANDVKSGNEVSEDDIITATVDARYVASDAISYSDLSGDIKKVAKINLKSGAILTSDMITNADEQLTDSQRIEELNMLVLPSDLSEGDYIDIRLTLPNGQDYIVISRKRVISSTDSTITIKMTEDEILTMTNAIVEAYIVDGSRLRAIKYVTPGMQNTAVPTYTVSKEVLNLIETNSNITTEARNTLYTRYKSDRRSEINTVVSANMEDYVQKVQAGFEQQNQKAQTERKEYIEKKLGGSL